MKFVAFLIILLLNNNLFSKNYYRNVTNQNSFLRGKEWQANQYKKLQRDTYFLTTQPDVDTECRKKIYNCLSQYCGDITVVPGKRTNGCNNITENELYNYALLCLYKDKSVLLPQYGANTRNGTGGINTASRLCLPYIQQELMSFLSMSNMAEQLTKSRSDLCINRRRELEAAFACQSVALANQNSTNSQLSSQLNDACGAGTVGGSAEMVARFYNAGNIGANVIEWAEKIVSLELNNRGSSFIQDINNIVISYTNRMNLACGDNLKLNLSQDTTNNNVNFPKKHTINDNNNFNKQNVSLWHSVISLSDIYNFDTAKQIIHASLTNSPFIENDFLQSSQIDNIQKAYKSGVKVFIIKDNIRCYIIEVAKLTEQEQSLLSQNFVNCVSR